MDLVEAVAGDVFAQFFEVAAFADLALGMQAEGAPMQKQGGQVLALL